MNVEEYIASEYGTAEAKKPVELTEKQLEYNVRQAFITGQSYPSEETARKIWDAAENYYADSTGVFDVGHPPSEIKAPDFETFYKQLIEGK